jgi:hypothetical protein
MEPSMSFLKKLFGLGDSSGTTPVAASKQAEHNGFIIEARPYAEGGQYQLAGVIAKDIDGARKEHRFVRADRFASADEAAEFALAKARQIIDERGDKVFD